MALYKIPSSVLLGNDSGNGIRVIAIQAPTNGYTLQGKVRMVATDVLYTPPSSTADQPISTDVFGYTIQDMYGQTRSANVRVKFEAEVTDPDCRFFIAMDRTISRANYSADRFNPAQTAGFEGWAAGQFIVATICTTGTNGVFLPNWTKITATTVPAPADATVSIYTHVVSKADADDWNANGFQLVTPTTGDSTTTSPTSSYLYGTISGTMRVFDICDLDPASLVVSASCDFYPDGATYTPETRLGPVFYGSDLYFFNPTKVTPGVFPPASPISVAPSMGIYTAQYNALQYTQLGFVPADAGTPQPCGSVFTVKNSSGFMVARYVLKSTVLGY